MKLLKLDTVIRTVGRGVVCYAPRWDPGSGIQLVQSGAGDANALTPLGDTEGDVSIALNEDVAALTLPELTGTAEVEAEAMGENPVGTFPLFVADPRIHAVLSPIGSAHGGASRRRPVVEYTVAIFPEALFLEPGTEGRQKECELTCPGGVWKLDNGTGAVNLTDAQKTMLAQALWLWRCYFKRPSRDFKGAPGNAAKEIQKVTCQVMHHESMPDGQHLYTAGDPFLVGVDLNGGS